MRRAAALLTGSALLAAGCGSASGSGVGDKDGIAEGNARNAVSRIEACLKDPNAGDPAVARACGKGDAVVTAVGARGIIKVIDKDDYAVSAVSRSGTRFVITKRGTTGFTRTCNAPSRGGCGAGTW